MDWHRDLLCDSAGMDLLAPGAPGDPDVQYLLKDTEEKLKLGHSSIEQCLKDLQGKIGEPWAGDRPSSPTESLPWFNPRNPNGPKPIVTGHQELLEFYKALQQYLKSVERSEEVVLQLLIGISYQCGVSFPSTAPLASSSSALTLPSIFCSVREDSTQELLDLWEEVRLQLQHHLLKELEPSEALETGEEVKEGVEKERGGEENGAFRVPRRVFCVKQLLFLYPMNHVLTRYQRLQTQAVQALVQRAYSSGPAAAERGFQRLVKGFQTAVPALLAMLNEDLYVLTNAGIEPQAFPTFLNHAYLSTVSKELGALMEKVMENTQKENTISQGKGGRRFSRGKATVVPQEPGRKAWNFSLTSHQLGCLAGLAASLLDLEQRVEELACDVGSSHCTGESSCNPRGSSKKSKEDLEVPSGDGCDHAACDPNPTPVETMSLEFEWRRAFGALVPQMSHCVKVLLEDLCARSLQQEEVAHASSAVLVPVTVPQTRGSGGCGPISSTCLERDVPKMITKFCSDVMVEVDNLFPLAVACRDDCLLPVRWSFIEVCARVVLALLTRLQERAHEVPTDAPFQNLCGLLSTSIFLRQQLEHYQRHLSDTVQMPLSQFPTKKCLDLSNSLQEQLTSYCLNICISSLLQDAESHHWSDPKPFYEDERCSFSIQMWHYFLSGLRHDLWWTLPPDMARSLLAQVLCESLQPLVQRYSRAQPSYRRVQQLRSDITAILLCVQQLLWSVCEGLGELLASNTKSSLPLPFSSPIDWVASVHGLCMQLLNVMVVVTAPLKELCRTFQHDPESLNIWPQRAKPETQAETCPTKEEKAEPPPTDDDTAPPPQPEEGGATPPEGQGDHIHVPQPPEVELEFEPPSLAYSYWLGVLTSKLFPEDALRDSLNCEVSCIWLLRLLGAAPCSNPTLLLSTLLHSDCLILRTLMANSYFCEEQPVEVPEEIRQGAEAFVEAVVVVLSSLDRVPRALTLVLEPYLTKAQLWEHLYNFTDPGHSEPVVLRCIRAIVSRPADTLLRQLVNIVQATDDHSSSLCSQTVAPECLLSKVPKVWNFSPHDVKGRDNSKSKLVAMHALSYIFSHLPSLVASLPLSVRFLFAVAERRLSQHARQLRATGLLLWVLLGRLCQGLEDPEAVERLVVVTGSPLGAPGLERGVRERLALVSECLQAAVGQQRGVPKAQVHMVLEALEERRPKWISIQLHKARKLCCKSVLERVESEWLSEKELAGGSSSLSAPMATASSSIQATELRTHHLMLELNHRPGCLQHLRQIYHIITLNEELLWRALLSVHTTANEDLPPLSVAFNLPGGATSTTRPHFNPLTQFDYIGFDKFDQAGLNQREWPWETLLPAYQTMSQISFRVLLQNRWEMQEDADLEEEEKAMVDLLRQTWFGPSPPEASAT